MPLRVIICWLFKAASVTEICPVLVPDAVGVKVVSIVQFRPADSDAPQSLVSAKSPLTEILATFRGRPPRFGEPGASH